MGNRLKTGLIAGAYLAVATYLGGYLFKFTFFVITMIALYEYDKAVNNNKNHVYILNYLVTIAIFASNALEFNIDPFLVLASYMVAAGVFYVIDSSIKLFDISSTIFGFLYVVILMYHVVLLGDTIYIWAAYAVSFSADSFAYLVGIRYGKHKLSPKLSPKKSVEGVVGGLAGAIAVMVILNIFLIKGPVSTVVLISIVGVLGSVFGDLVASKIKREYNVKDYGNVLPGHGGMLDRFDSFLIVAPIVYYMTLYLL
ncbi:phosphatidate cytidylyltransferase [Dethiosulfatibacter aminovorans DSM 17477]|uniref:Phosphatidate cytidylyltransferase n=1 Tax=Dethiosulfatibacter aminovorans DSM 17477 TaxID=1121476 RepID=A0A1M6DEL1_9FIRM|nr:phosphatidate cytidylyltransferase [Dethiosulfatibacter aminovorans]SHI71539.1 phosphatidate cytidylyltransferase [Dethiosulfatibacter aminovorans DSM 17477]